MVAHLHIGRENVAIYHLSVKIIGRSSSRNAVAAAAYRAATELYDDRLREVHDKFTQAPVVHSEIMLPHSAPDYLLDRETLWNKVEAREVRRDARLAREIEVALPRELDKPEAIRLVRDFVQEQFVSRGMIADLNVHWGSATDGESQPHAHVMLTMRSVDADGFGHKVRDWDHKDILVGWRERWASLMNQRMTELGHDISVDHRSLVEQGITLKPQVKIGPASGSRHERVAESDVIARENGQRIIDDPTIVLHAITRQHPTFTRQDIAKFVHRYSDGLEQFADAMARVEASPELVRIEGDRFTTRERIAAQQHQHASMRERLSVVSQRLGAAVRTVVSKVRNAAWAVATRWGVAQQKVKAMAEQRAAVALTDRHHHRMREEVADMDIARVNGGRDVVVKMWGQADRDAARGRMAARQPSPEAPRDTTRQTSRFVQ